MSVILKTGMELCPACEGHSPVGRDPDRQCCKAAFYLNLTVKQRDDRFQKMRKRVKIDGEAVVKALREDVKVLAEYWNAIKTPDDLRRERHKSLLTRIGQKEPMKYGETFTCVCEGDMRFAWSNVRYIGRLKYSIYDDVRFFRLAAVGVRKPRLYLMEEVTGGLYDPRLRRHCALPGMKIVGLRRVRDGENTREMAREMGGWRKYGAWP